MWVFPWQSGSQDDFAFLGEDQLELWASDFVFGPWTPVEQIEKRLLVHDSKRWFLKHKAQARERKTDRLAWILAKDRANVAEVRWLTRKGWSELQKMGLDLGAEANRENSYLVRVVADHDLTELPHQDLDSAVASELMYSLWIRRRDTHAFNRYYIDGIPMFYDHQTTLAAEEDLLDLNVFFKRADNSGHAGAWRVVDRSSGQEPETHAMRVLCKSSGLAIHVVDDLERFNSLLDVYAELLHQEDPCEWHHAARTAGFGRSQSKKILEFLKTTRGGLEEGLARMRAVIAQDLS